MKSDHKEYNMTEDTKQIEITIHIDKTVLQWFENQAKKENKKYETLINDVLKTYVAHQKEKGYTKS